jgi:hypothetical protein
VTDRAPSSSRSRNAALGIFVAIVFATEIASLDFRDTRARIVRALAPHDLARDRIEGTDFLFDRGYGEFLDRLSRTAPPATPVRLCVPATNELYDYAAAYVLAPRPVGRAPSGGFAYRCPEPGAVPR